MSNADSPPYRETAPNAAESKQSHTKPVMALCPMAGTSNGGDPTTELVMTDNEGRGLNLEEVGRMLDHPLFWYMLKGTVLQGVELA
jgi:hypothetical protein